MKMKVFAIRDVAANRFFAPQMEYNDLTARRWFGELINNGAGPLNFQPKDYDLFEVGDFDTEKGEICATAPIRLVCTGVDVYINEK